MVAIGEGFIFTNITGEKRENKSNPCIVYMSLKLMQDLTYSYFVSIVWTDC